MNLKSSNSVSKRLFVQFVSSQIPCQNFSVILSLALSWLLRCRNPLRVFSCRVTFLSRFAKNCRLLPLCCSSLVACIQLIGRPGLQGKDTRGLREEELTEKSFFFAPASASWLKNFTAAYSLNQAEKKSLCKEKNCTAVNLLGGYRWKISRAELFIIKQYLPIRFSTDFIG